MARPRTPSRILELRGSFKHNPHRRRQDAENDQPIGEPPDRLSDSQKLAWSEIVDSCYPGVLNASHRHAVEYAARWLAIMWYSNVPPKEFRFALSSLGMTPVDASKVIQVQASRASRRFD